LAAPVFRERREAARPEAKQAPSFPETRTKKREPSAREDPPERDLTPFAAPPQVLIARPEAPVLAAAPPASASRVAETQALVERFVTSMRVGRSSKGAEVHMTLDGRASEVRVRELGGRLEVELRGDDAGAFAERVQSALQARGLDADVRCVRE
jgi:hypothetical protein